MHIKSAWSYLNKELLAILSILVVSTIAALMYLTHTLTSLHTHTTQGSRAIGTAFILQDLLVDMQDVQNSTRGYVITGDDAFLAQYTAARERIPSELHIIKTNQDLFIDDAQAKRLENLVNEGLKLMQRTTDMRMHEGFEPAQAVIATGEGQALMSSLRKEITSISSYGLKNIGPMQQRSEANLRRAMIVAGTLIILVLGTCVAIVWYFRHAILRERALESTKNEFLSLASHQLRTPATNVKQYIGLLLDGYMGPLNDQQRHALNVANKNNEAEISIMNNLLDVAKLDLDRIQLHKEVTNVVKIIKHVVRDSKPRAKEHGHTIKVKAPEQLMASVDRAYIEGVVENLIDNAIKYSKDCTTITVRVAREQDMLVLAVKDQGVGIKKRDLSKLFNKFSRLDNEFSANSQGSGLGLYWVKKIVTLHRGTIDVSSREGKGSVFTVRLPVR